MDSLNQLGMNRGIRKGSKGFRDEMFLAAQR
jgi:hypothetical protein